MDYIRKLPLLMALAAAIITGLMGYINQVRNNENMTNMLIVMVVFYIVGLLIRGTILEAIETNRKKEEERIQEEKRIAAEKEKEEKRKKKENEKDSGGSIDMVADEDLDQGIREDEFHALPIADYITKELNE